mgnify:CR=1 FL=1
MLNRYRDKLKKLIEPVAKILVNIGISPNLITIIGLIITIISGYQFYVGNSLYGGFILLLGAFSDILDGSVARISGRESKFGAFLDSTIDRASDGIVIFSIGLGGLSPWNLCFLAFMGTYLVSYTRGRAESLGAKNFTVGVGERAERLLLIVIFALINKLLWGMIALNILAWFTVLQRIIAANKKL